MTTKLVRIQIAKPRSLLRTELSCGENYINLCLLKRGFLCAVGLTPDSTIPRASVQTSHAVEILKRCLPDY